MEFASLLANQQASAFITKSSFLSGALVHHIAPVLKHALIQSMIFLATATIALFLPAFLLMRSNTSSKCRSFSIHPASIKVSARDRVKTDKRDSLKMAQQLANGELKCINIPSENREQFRILTRTRKHMVEHKKRVGNQLKSLLFTQGLMEPYDDTKISKTWIKKIEQVEMSEEIRYNVNCNRPTKHI